MREFRFLDEKRKTNGLTPVEDQRWQELAATLGIDLSQQVQPQGYYGPDGQWYPYAPQGYDPQVWAGAPGAWPQGYYPPQAQPQGYYGPDGQWYQYPPQPQGYYGPDGQWYQYPPQAYAPQPGYAPQQQGYYAPDGQWVPTPQAPQPQWDPQTQQWVQPAAEPQAWADPSAAPEAGWEPPPQEAWQPPALDEVASVEPAPQAASYQAPTALESATEAMAEVSADEVMEIADEEVVEIPSPSPEAPARAAAPPLEVDPVAELREALSFDDEPELPAALSPPKAPDFRSLTAVTVPGVPGFSLHQTDRAPEPVRSAPSPAAQAPEPMSVPLLELPDFGAEAEAAFAVPPEPAKTRSTAAEPRTELMPVTPEPEPLRPAFTEPEPLDVSLEPEPLLPAFTEPEPLAASREPEPLLPALTEPEPYAASLESEPLLAGFVEPEPPAASLESEPLLAGFVEPEPLAALESEPLLPLSPELEPPLPTTEPEPRAASAQTEQRLGPGSARTPGPAGVLEPLSRRELVPESRPLPALSGSEPEPRHGAFTETRPSTPFPEPRPLPGKPAAQVLPRPPAPVAAPEPAWLAPAEPHTEQLAVTPELEAILTGTEATGLHTAYAPQPEAEPLQGIERVEAPALAPPSQRTTLPVLELSDFEIEPTLQHQRLDISRTTTPVEVPAFDAPPFDTVQASTPREALTALSATADDLPLIEASPPRHLEPAHASYAELDTELEGPRETTQIVSFPVPAEEPLEAFARETTQIVAAPVAPAPATPSAFDGLALPPDPAPIPTFEARRPPPSKPTAPSQPFPAWEDVPEPPPVSELLPASPFGGSWSNEEAVDLATPPERRLHQAQPAPAPLAPPAKVVPAFENPARPFPRITAEEAWPSDTSGNTTLPRVNAPVPVADEWDDLSVEQAPVLEAVVEHEPTVLVDLSGQPQDRVELAQNADFIGSWKDAPASPGADIEIDTELGSFEVESGSPAALATGTSETASQGFSDDKVELATNADFIGDPQLTGTGEAWHSSPSNIELEGEVLVGEVIHEPEPQTESWGAAVSAPAPLPSPIVRSAPPPLAQRPPPQSQAPVFATTAPPPALRSPVVPPLADTFVSPAAVARPLPPPPPVQQPHAPEPVPLGEGPLSPSGAFRGPVQPPAAPEFDRSGTFNQPEVPIPVHGDHRVILHTLEGGVKRGSLHEADLTAPQVLLETAPGTVERVPRERVKAIFFMLAPGSRSPPPAGAKVRVTFRDGRQVAGFSNDHTTLKTGFFVVPADNRTNTDRIFIYRHSISTVTVES